MSTIHGALAGDIAELAALPQDRTISFVKGAPDGLIEHATSVYDGTDVVEFDAERRRRALDFNNAMAAGGMRVLGLAYRTLYGPDDDPNQSLTLLGLIGNHRPAPCRGS